MGRAGCSAAVSQQDGNTALMWACIGDHAEIARTLIGACADVNAKNNVYANNNVYAKNNVNANNAFK